MSCPRLYLRQRPDRRPAPAEFGRAQGGEQLGKFIEVQTIEHQCSARGAAAQHHRGPTPLGSGGTGRAQHQLHRLMVMQRAGQLGDKRAAWGEIAGHRVDGRALGFAGDQDRVADRATCAATVFHVSLPCTTCCWRLILDLTPAVCHNLG
ncbi:MAG: hypothetical protein EA371_06620 [Gammaproteobacteria bacterium]|nr:MAG: hypothetical protein EA371_06620 [Gammaproteobacteria bacterium]